MALLNRNRIALVMCPCWGREAPPLSISLLGGNLRSKGYEVSLFDLSNHFYHEASDEYKKFWGQEHYNYWNAESSVKEFISNHEIAVESALRKILDTGSKVIGISVVFSTLHFSLELAARIKQLSADRIVIMGGPQTSLFYSGKYILENENVDAIVLHEGDETLPELLRDLDKTGRFSKIPGLMYKENGVIVDGGMRKPIRSLNELPFADYSDFDLSMYANPHRLDISSSRSCINRCHYCDERNYFQTYRFRSGRNLYDEIVYQLKRHPSVNFFNFSDSVLNGSIDAVQEFCELLIKNKVNIGWGGQAVIRKEMTPELLHLMHEAGCSYLSYGLESGSNRVLASMNKKLFTVELAPVVLKNTHNAKISTNANVMFGYPTETDEDFHKTLRFIKQNRIWIDAISPSQSFMVILKNTYLYDHLSEFNIEPNPHHLYWKTIDGKNTYPIRFARYELFCKLCIDLNLSGVGVAEEKIDKWQLLGEYYFTHENDYQKAFECYKSDLLRNGYTSCSYERFISCSKMLNKLDEVQYFVEKFHLPVVSNIAHDADGYICSPFNHTDENWLNGVAKSWAAAFFIGDSDSAKRALTVGRRVIFKYGIYRKIIRTMVNDKSLIVYLDGNPLDGNVMGYPEEFSVS